MNKGTCEDKTTEITKSQGEKKMETRKQNLRNIYGFIDRAVKSWEMLMKPHSLTKLKTSS